MPRGVKYIYLDTNVWNDLCSKEFSPTELVARLADNGLQIAIGTHSVLELAKTFQSQKPNAHERAKQLFACLSMFLAHRVPCVKENRHLLRDEAKDAAGQILKFSPFYELEEYNLLTKEVEKLSRGVFDERANSFILRKKAKVAKFRQQMKDLLPDNRTAIMEYGNLKLEEFTSKVWPRWARPILRIELSRQFPRSPTSQLGLLSKKLLGSPKYRLSDALVRAHVYVNWQCLRRSSVPRDLLDDCFHVVNASYCDIYATKESAQEDYAPSILRHTAFALYRGSPELDDWLCSLLSN